jgi:hypothetical protein
MSYEKSRGKHKEDDSSFGRNYNYDPESMLKGNDGYDGYNKYHEQNGTSFEPDYHRGSYDPGKHGSYDREHYDPGKHEWYDGGHYDPGKHWGNYDPGKHSGHYDPGKHGSYDGGHRHLQRKFDEGYSLGFDEGYAAGKREKESGESYDSSRWVKGYDGYSSVEKEMMQSESSKGKLRNSSGQFSPRR